MTSFIILADLGRVKAYRISRDDFDPKSSLAFEDLADVDLVNKHSKISDRVRDKSGRHGYGVGSKALTESRREQEEIEGRQLKDIAGVINQTAGAGAASIYFAAPKPIIASLTEALAGSTGTGPESAVQPLTGGKRASQSKIRPGITELDD